MWQVEDKGTFIEQWTLYVFYLPFKDELRFKREKKRKLFDFHFLETESFTTKKKSFPIDTFARNHSFATFGNRSIVSIDAYSVTCHIHLICAKIIFFFVLFWSLLRFVHFWRCDCAFFFLFDRHVQNFNFLDHYLTFYMCWNVCTM